MDVALITVGDELLSGDTVNTNASWLAERLAARGVTVPRVLALPDDRATIAERVAAYADAFDRVIVTGGIGGTPDDVTVEAVADAFDRDLTVSPVVRADVEAGLAEIEARVPDRDVDVDVDAEAALPAESRPLLNEAGLAPGCVLEGVYVFPGIPDELTSMFESVADEFAGERRSRFLLEEVMRRYDVTVGCYPDRAAKHNRLKIVGTDAAAIDDAAAWLLTAIDASEEPVSRDWEAADG
jgi:molybdenum cofactor synthesis domain-containing protein